MEHSAKYDFFMSFKPIFNDKNEFEDYILTNISDNYKKNINKKSEYCIGGKLSDLFMDDEENIFIENDLHYYMVPNTKRKFERYLENLDRWYAINIFSDATNYLHLFFTDITKLKMEKQNFIPFTKLDNESNLLSFDYFVDRLTGLYTKDYFEMEIQRWDTERQLPISIIIGDLNGLKLINDAFGHKMGDKALKTIGKIMKESFRKEDIVSRFRGDEFVVLLPKTTEKTCLEIIDRMKLELDNNPLDFIKLSMSFGTDTKTHAQEDISHIMKKAEEKMYFNKLRESRDAKEEMIDYLRDKLAKISFETKQHHERLINLCIILANELNLSEIEKEELRLLCNYHDIGKAGIPNYILHKEEPLNNEEWNHLRRHSEIGYHIMKASGQSLAIDELILMHHERWDGGGYPGLLKGEEIPVVVRIFALADAYEAMVNHRPYKERLSNEEALREIEDKAGTQFDPKLAKIFIRLMEGENLNVI